MTLVNVNSVAQVFQAQVELLTVSVNDSGELGNILVTNSDNSTILVPFTAAGSVTLTRDAIKDALEANSAVTDKYSMADVSTDGVSMTQLALTGPFTAVGNNLGGTLAIVPTTSTPAAFPTPRYKLDLKSPVAGASGETYVSRDTLRKCPGEYTLVANAVTTVIAPSLLVEDTNNLLAPAPGPFSCGEYSGYMDNGLTTAKNGPEWVKNWILVKEEIEIGDPVVTRVTDDDYTVVPADKHIYLTSTTSAGDHTITFAAGMDGQKVTLMTVLVSGTDEFIIAGVEDIGAAPLLMGAGDSKTFTYDKTADEWRTSSEKNQSAVRHITDASTTILETDEEVFLTGTTSAGDKTITFAAGLDGQKVVVRLDVRSGTDVFVIAGVEDISSSEPMRTPGDSMTVVYDATADKWRLSSRVNQSAIVAIADASYTVLHTDRVVNLKATTSAGNYTVTFGTGVDGQMVTVFCEDITGSDIFFFVGVDDFGSHSLNAKGDTVDLIYNASEDIWVIQSTRIAGVIRVTDSNYTVGLDDTLLLLTSTTSAGSYTITFPTGTDGQRVRLVTVSQLGTDGFGTSGIEGGGAFLNATLDNAEFIYGSTEDKWFYLDGTITP